MINSTPNPKNVNPSVVYFASFPAQDVYENPDEYTAPYLKFGDDFLRIETIELALDGTAGYIANLRNGTFKFIPTGCMLYCLVTPQFAAFRTQEAK